MCVCERPEGARQQCMEWVCWVVCARPLGVCLRGVCGSLWGVCVECMGGQVGVWCAFRGTVGMLANVSLWGVWAIVPMGGCSVCVRIQKDGHVQCVYEGNSVCVFVCVGYVDRGGVSDCVCVGEGVGCLDVCVVRVCKGGLGVC